jgi:hypothetical protein
MRSSSRSNSSGERVVQKRAILRAISRRAAAIASDFRRSSIEQDQRSIKIGRSLQEFPPRLAEPELKKKSRYKRFLSRGSPGVCYRSFIRIAFEARVLFRPAMQLAAGRTLDGIHLLDGRSLERLRIHREAGVDHFSGRRTLDQDAVHTFLARAREPGACPTTCKESSA